MFEEDGYLMSDELDPIKIGCPKTPERNSYFCKKHKSNEPVLTFNVNQVPTKFRLSSIKSYFVKDTFKIRKIHDVFCEKIDHDDGKDDDEEKANINILYLVETTESDKPLCWVRKNV